MSRAFPRVTVSSIQAQRATDESALGQFFPGDNVEGTLERVNEFIGSGEKLVYNLSVNAATERGAMATARAYVRAKNPFDPQTITIESVSQTSGGRSLVQKWAKGIEETGVIFPGGSSDFAQRVPQFTETYSVKASIEK